MKRNVLKWILAFSIGLNLILVGALVGWFKPSPSPRKHQREERMHWLQFDEEMLGLTEKQSRAMAELRDQWDREEWENIIRELEAKIKFGDALVEQQSTNYEQYEPQFFQLMDVRLTYYGEIIEIVDAHLDLLDESQREVFWEQLRQKYYEHMRRAMMRGIEKYQQRLAERGVEVEVDVTPVPAENE